MAYFTVIQGQAFWGHWKRDKELWRRVEILTLILNVTKIRNI